MADEIIEVENDIWEMTKSENEKGKEALKRFIENYEFDYDEIKLVEYDYYWLVFVDC